MSDVFQRVANRISTYEDKAIEYETRLTAIPALGPENSGDGEFKKAKYIKTVLQQLKADDIQEIKAPDDRVSAGYRPNLVAKFRGQDHSRTIWIMAHMDVVPPGKVNLWTGDPWTVRVEGGKIIGRGTEDNQQGIVSGILAVQALREEGITPEYDVGLLLVADEETGSKYGLKYIAKDHPELFRKEDIIIIPDAGNKDGTMIEVAEKSILWTKFRTVGKQCHGSTPDQGINAHRAGANLIVRLDALYKIFDKKDPLFDPPVSTFEPTKKDPNVANINTIPGEDVFYQDARILPDYSLVEVEKKIREMVAEIEKKFKVKIETEHMQREEAPPSTPSDAPVVEALKWAVKEVYGREAKTIGIGGGTVAAFFRRAGFHAAVWSTMDELAHQPDEYARIENILGDAKVFAHIFLQRY